MTKKQIEKALGKRAAGSFCVVTVARPMATRASCPHEITKRTQYRFQLTTYARREPVARGVATGQRDAPELPPWIKRSEILKNGLKFWHGHNGQVYLALPVFGDGGKFKSEFFIDGEVATKRKVNKFLTAAEKRNLEKVKTEKIEREAKFQAMARGVKLEHVIFCG
jgi:hypothetical protein